MKSSSIGTRAQIALGVAFASVPFATDARPTAPSPRSADLELPRSIAWQSATEQPRTAFLGSAWRAAIDTSTRVPARLWGPGLAAPGTVGSPEVALAFARDFLATHLAALAPGSSMDDFQLVANDVDTGQRTVAFAQHHRGIPVLGGQLSLRFKNDRLFLISSQAIPVAAGPRALQANATATSLAAHDRPIFLPFPADDGSTELRLVRSVIAANDFDRFEVFVDAATNEPIAHRSLVHRASGTLQFNAPLTHAGTGGSRMDYPAPTLSVTLDGVSAETGADGTFSFATASAQLAVGVAGRFVEVLTEAGDPFAQVLTATDGAVLTVDRRDDEIADAQISAYVHVNAVKNWARTVTAGSLPWVDEKLVVKTNYPSVCNAFYDGGEKTLNFFQSGSLAGVACQNTALIADVVHHEFGHALHDNAIIAGAGRFDPSVSEGFGDYVAATMSNDPRMGLGFFADQPTTPMRHLDDVDRALPDDVAPDVHTNGLIFGGALWDLRKALTARLGADGTLLADRLIYQGMRRTTDMATTYLEVLAADDDDGNLVNGTPNGCDITAAFAAHGLVPDGAYGTAGVQRPVIEDDAIVVHVRPSACPDAAVEALSVDLRRRGIAGSEETTTLKVASTTPDSDGFIRHEAALPTLYNGDVLQYRVTAELSGGGEIHLPENDADPYYEHFVGETNPVFCDSLDGGAYPLGFTHKLTAGDQGYGADEWMWGPSRATIYSGDPQAAYSGDKIFGTDLGGAQSEGWYAAARSSRLSTPVVMVGALDENTRVHLQYRRWVVLGAGDRVEIAANEQPVWSSVQPGPSAPLHRDREWRFHDVDVTDQVAADGSLRIDFTIIADAKGEGGGWSIDDICVVTTVAPTCPTADCLDDAGGCGCRLGAGSTGSTGAVVLLTAMLVFRRRRARRA